MLPKPRPSAEILAMRADGIDPRRLYIYAYSNDAKEFLDREVNNYFGSVYEVGNGNVFHDLRVNEGFDVDQVLAYINSYNNKDKEA